MFDLLNRLRNFDPRKMTPMQLVLLAVAIIVALWLIQTLLSIAATLMPIAVLAILAYVAWRVLSSRGEDAAQVARQKREATITHAGRSTERAAQQIKTVASQRLNDTPAASATTVDPATGLQKVDLAKMEEREKRLLEQAQATSADAVQQQLEERRKRLLGGQ